MLRSVLLLALLLLPSTALAEVPLPVFPDCGTGGACPSDYSPEGDWNLSSTLPPSVSPEQIPEDQRALGSGLWADRAWATTTGRTDVVIAVLDSGIQWDNRDLLNKHFIHVGELPAEAASPDPECVPEAQRLNLFDCDGNGVVNIADWANDPRVLPDLGDNATGHPDAVKDPSDLIALWSDGVDDDGNGYVDDISGWDFFWNDNNPYDDTRYGHGTGEARDSASEGGDGGSIGTCPNCMVLNVRVSDSFVADANNFGLAVLYAVDMGALVIQEALGALNNSELVVDAIEYAWNRGVTTIASAADETAYHQNYPGNNHHTVYIHAIRYDTNEREAARTFFSYSNCTNYGGKLVLSAPSTSCSSGAVGVGSGVAGLMYSAMKDALEAGTLATPLTANEAHQLLVLTADDIAFNPDDDDPEQYPSREGWERHFGYGRMNAKTIVEAVAAGDIPPEADLLEPTWFEVLNIPAGGTVDVTGYAAADRSTSYTWDLQVGAGLDPVEGDFRSVATGEGTEPTSGVLHRLDLRAVPVDAGAVIEAYVPGDDNVSKADKAFVHAATLRLQVRDAEGRLGEMRKTIYVQDDPDLLPGYPRRIGASFDGSIKLADVDGDGLQDVVYFASGGWVHVTDWTGAPLPGFPVQVPLLDELRVDVDANHLASPALASGEVTTEAGHAITAAPAIGDLDGDGSPEIVVSTLNGVLMVWHADGRPAAGWPFRLDPAHVEFTDPDNVYDYGFFATPALGDLDRDGDLEIVVGAMDAHMYAFHHDGTHAQGFPVELRHEYGTENDRRSNGERIISSAALGDVDGDGFLEIAVGSNQKTTGTYGIGYLLSHTGEIEPGWPAELFGAYTNALPFVGEGVPGSPTLCDFDGDGTLEVAMHTIADNGKLLRWDGSQAATMARLATEFGYFSNTDEPAANLIMINSGAWGDIDVDGVPDYAIGSAGFEYANGLIDDGRRHDHDHLLSAWSGATVDAPSGARMPFIDGFPQVMEDMQFFLNPSIADLDGDGLPEVVNGSAGHVVHAFDRDGREPAGWPKNTGQWLLGSPAIGDADHDGYLDVWIGTRSGFIYAWRTTARADEARRDWGSFRHDPANTGNCETPLAVLSGPAAEEPGGCEDCESTILPADPTAGIGVCIVLSFACLRRRYGRFFPSLEGWTKGSLAPTTTLAGRFD